MGKGLIALIVVVVVIGLIVAVFFGQYIGTKNTLVQKNEAVKAAWSQVDIVLQRRADLIPIPSRCSHVLLAVLTWADVDASFVHTARASSIEPAYCD